MVTYTTVFGNTDPLHEPLVDGRFVCFTDQPIRSKRWEIVQVPPLGRPNRECRRVKCLSHAMFPDEDLTLWIDCNFVLRMPLTQIAERYTAPLTAFRHHRRQRITDEAVAIVQARKGRKADIDAQLAAYRADGWDTDDSPQQVISCGGFLLRRHTPEVVAFNERWHYEVQTRSLRDQMSIDYAAWQCGLPIAHFAGNVNRNDMATLKHYERPTTDF